MTNHAYSLWCNKLATGRKTDNFIQSLHFN